MVAAQDTRVTSEPDFTSLNSNDERTLKQLEQDWLDTYREGDADKLSRILADDFVGRWGREHPDKRGAVESHSELERKGIHRIVWTSATTVIVDFLLL